MIHHDNTTVFKSIKFTNSVEFLELFTKLKFEVDKANNVRTIAHYISPQLGNVSMSNISVAEVMENYGMDVIPVCGDQLAEEMGIQEDLGLILEHQADGESIEFKQRVDEISTCLYQLGWNYDGWVGEFVEEFKETVILQ